MHKTPDRIPAKPAPNPAAQAESEAQTFYTVLRDPAATPRGKYYVSSYSSRQQAEWTVENSMMNVETDLIKFGFELKKIKHPVMVIGPTCTIGDSTDTLFPEVDYVFKKLRDSARLYVVEPSGPYFPSLERYARSLPPELSRKLFLVNEEAGHMHWNGPKGFEGVPDSSIGLVYSTLTFAGEVMSDKQLQDSIAEVGRVLMPGGFFVMDSTSYDQGLIRSMLPRNKLELLTPDKHLAHVYLRKLK